MNLQNLRSRLSKALELSGESQYGFAEKHGISYSYLNKFLKGWMTNPRLSTLNDFERVIGKYL